ncbi:MAG: phospholipase A [Rubrivivax sp.]
MADCNAIDVDVDRLTCYDRRAGRGPRTSDPKESGPSPAAAANSEQAAAAARVATTEERLAESLTLSTVWELAPADQRGTFKLLPHQTNYLLPVRWSSAINTRPFSPAPEHGQSERLPIQPFEAKFQFSVKTKAVENIFGQGSDLWLAYTQQSNWQIYNGSGSSPVRENDYEPEAILSFATDADVLGWRWRLLNIGLVHQSNGRPLPLSRSWNRVTAQFGFERGGWTLLARPWFRIPESSSGDDNPDIVKNLGWGDLRASYQRNGNVWSALGRINPRSGRGSLQLDWAFPLSGALRGYLQVTDGRGESLVDYNHSQTTIGFGLLLLPWQ